jgi:hypothetical protein
MPSNSEKRRADLEAVVGHPRAKWLRLQARVQDEAITQFTDVADDWLDIMWTLDAYRIERVPPLDMGKEATDSSTRLDAIYRGKGNWFASLLALLLENRTDHKLAPRVDVQGFSQNHQIDVAWPDRGTKPMEDPLVCLETKVTGAPAYGSTPARGAMSDWSNRRKELKFQATDLKLYRRQQETSIEHWDVWRQREMPKVYFLWAGRMGPKDRMEKMIAETQALVKTYLDAAGIFAWKENAYGTGYEPVPVPQADRVSSVDDVLYRIASEIKVIAPRGQAPPPPQRPSHRALDPAQLHFEQAADERADYDAEDGD